MTSFTITGYLADVWQKQVYPAEIRVEQGIIRSIQPLLAGREIPEQYILPGFIDSHVHIESSMLVPAEFARLAVMHGTVATVSDPHEIANVCGMEGVEFMIANGKTSPFKFYFGAPSCVPATQFETAGATLDVQDVETLLQKDEIKYLSEMMNFPGVLFKDPEVMAKIAAAHKWGKPVDGHAPGLRGAQARQYIEAGISTDHECFTEEEALDKLRYGMKILIREGSAAKNFEALIGLLNHYPDHIMFCSDDKHPDSLVAGHIDQLCARAIDKGIDLFKVLQAACVNPVLHYRLNVGLLREGDPADFIVAHDLERFKVIATYIDGKAVHASPHNTGAEAAAIPLPADAKTAHAPIPRINNFNCALVKPEDFAIPYTGQQVVPVIEALDGQLITNRIDLPAGWLLDEDTQQLVSNTTMDILKIAVVNRYRPSKPSLAFIKNIGLQAGALASSVAHDSHNIVAVGVDDDSLFRAINLVIANQGGVSCCGGTTGRQDLIIPLPVAGLMSDENGYEVAHAYTTIDAMAKSLGSQLAAPFMTLSFMALLVIPHLKLSDRGLFDGDQFKLI
jgi:adenine deaminase